MATTLTNKATVTYSLLGVNLSIDSNTINFNKVVNVVTATKSVNPTAGKSGDTVTFTITVVSTDVITTVVVTDALVGFTFVPGTVKIDGTTQASADPNTGITLGGMGINVTKTITFNATVN